MWRLRKRRRQASKANPDVHKAFQCKGARTPICSNNIHELHPGDHIAWKRTYGLWHHAIVVETGPGALNVQVVDFTKANKQLEIAKRLVDIRTENGQCFLFKYSAEVIENNPPHIVLKRAHGLLGRKDFHFFKNNCEHFATFCKTGKKFCTQNRTARRKLMEAATTCVASTGKAEFKAGCELGTQSYAAVVECAGKAATAKSMELFGSINKEATIKAAGLVAIIEIGHCTYDIYRLIQNRKRGNMTETDFRISVTERVFEASGSGGFAIGFSIVGESIGGIIGFFLTGSVTLYCIIGGNIIGYATGSLFGKYVGSFLGNWLGKRLWKY